MRARFFLGPVFLALAIVGCGGGGGGAAAIDARIEAHPDWRSDYAGKELIRLRRKSSEALLEVTMHPLGAAGVAPDFEAFCRLWSYPTRGEERNATVGGANARRIAFSGVRGDTGERRTGVVYFVDRGSTAYRIDLLAAGTEMEEAMREGESMIESLSFGK